jgi:hypothetical protein
MAVSLHQQIVLQYAGHEVGNAMLTDLVLNQVPTKYTQL